MNPNERIIFALDVDNGDDAKKWVKRLAGKVGFFKVGLELFVSAGPSLVEEIVASGEKVFLDLKFHDIPNTVAGAVRTASKLGASIVNIHCLAGSDAMKRTVEAASEGALKGGVEVPKLIGVTVLTSHSQSTLDELGISGDTTSSVERLATLARDNGLDGVVASPMEAGMIRSLWAGGLIVTPGVRPTGSALDDQNRVATPGGAIASGADYIVVGRPIRKADDPVAAAIAIADEIAKVTG